MYAKLIDGKLVYPPQIQKRNDGTTAIGYDRMPDLLIADGWKQVVPTTAPADGRQYDCRYAETATEIVQCFDEHIPTAAEIAAAELAERMALESAAAEEARLAALAVERANYAATCRRACELAGIEPADRIMLQKLADEWEHVHAEDRAEVAFLAARIADYRLRLGD